jgi:hypothetical protein
MEEVDLRYHLLLDVGLLAAQRSILRLLDRKELCACHKSSPKRP